MYRLPRTGTSERDAGRWPAPWFDSFTELLLPPSRMAAAMQPERHLTHAAGAVAPVAPLAPRLLWIDPGEHGPWTRRWRVMTDGTHGIPHSRPDLARLRRGGGRHHRGAPRVGGARDAPRRRLAKRHGHRGAGRRTQLHGRVAAARSRCPEAPATRRRPRRGAVSTRPLTRSRGSPAASAARCWRDSARRIVAHRCRRGCDRALAGRRGLTASR